MRRERTGASARSRRLGGARHDVAGDDLEAFLEALLSLVERHRIQLLLPGLDPELPLLARHRARFESLGCRVVVSDPGIVATCQDKLACYQWLAAEEEPFVATWALDELLKSERTAFPLFLKPMKGSGSKFLQVAFTKPDLWSVQDPGAYVAQAFLLPVGWGIPSVKELKPAHVWKNGQLRQEDDLSVQGLLDESGELVALAVLLKEFFAGMSVKAVPFRHEEVEAVSASIFRRMGRRGARGSCNLQGRLTAEGFRVYELNPRMSGATAIRAALGFNECRAVVDLWLGGLSVEEVAPRLRLAEDQICLRYLTECVVPLARVEELRQGGPAAG